MASAPPELTPVNVADYLDQDPSIRGQKYCCISFVSPEDVIKAKEAYFFQKFLKSFSDDMKGFFENSIETFAKEAPDVADKLRAIRDRFSYVYEDEKLQEEFEFYKAQHGDKLESEYLEKNNFQTTIRGFKVRGSYDSVREAELRAQVLKRMDDKFHVFIAEVGCWCPWSPNPEELQNQEYAETQLNTLVKGYTENQARKDEYFMQRKNDMMARAYKEGQNSNVAAEPTIEVVESLPEDAVTPDEAAEKVEKECGAVLEDIAEGLESDDPWTQRKKEQQQAAVATDTAACEPENISQQTENATEPDNGAAKLQDEPADQ